MIKLNRTQRRLLVFGAIIAFFGLIVLLNPNQQQHKRAVMSSHKERPLLERWVGSLDSEIHLEYHNNLIYSYSIQKERVMTVGFLSWVFVDIPPGAMESQLTMLAGILGIILVCGLIVIRFIK